jgi:AraC-like DNA-binding protein
MPKFVFSSDDLPVATDDRARFHYWRDTYNTFVGAADLLRSHDRPFSGRLECVLAGKTMVIRQQSSVDYWARTSGHIAGERRGDGDFLLGFNRSLSPARVTQRNREVALTTGEVTLFSNAEPIEVRAPGDMAVLGLGVPRARLVERIAHVDDLTIRRLNAATPAARHLREYLTLLLNSDTFTDDPLLVSHAETTVLDLLALTLGADRDVAEIAQMRGLRAVRLQEILRAIKENYAKPAFGAQSAARQLGVSARYVNDLLHETGRGLTERVLELRLQKARAMLADGRNGRSRILEIAYHCGFNDASYFNRCFRRRFGGPPSQFRSITHE